MPVAIQPSMTNYQPDRLLLATRAASVGRAALRTLRVWGRRYRERHMFPFVDERDLRDMRLTYWDLEQELAKPFWRD